MPRIGYSNYFLLLSSIKHSFIYVLYTKCRSAKKLRYLAEQGRKWYTLPLKFKLKVTDLGAEYERQLEGKENELCTKLAELELEQESNLDGPFKCLSLRIHAEFDLCICK